jgi:hypothetical protein
MREEDFGKWRVTMKTRANDLKEKVRNTAADQENKRKSRRWSTIIRETAKNSNMLRHLMFEHDTQQAPMQVRDRKGTLHTSPEGLKAAYTDHYYTNLLGKHPIKPDHAPEWGQQHPMWDNLKNKWNTDIGKQLKLNLGKPPTAKEIIAVIQRAKGGSSPGLDGVQYDVLKALLDIETGEEKTQTPNEQERTQNKANPCPPS